MRKLALVSLVSIAAFLTASAPRTVLLAQLSDRALEQASALGLGHDEVSFLLVDADGAVLAAHRDSTPVPPASALKLLTACAAYDLLGADFQFRTELRHAGEIRGGVLEGDLVVVGRGDPGFSGRFYGGDPMRAFDPWIEELQRLGVTRVSGRLLGDDRYLAGPQRHGDWPRAQLHRWYCAPSGALNLNDNCVDVCIAPAASGQRIDVELRPATDLFRVDTKIRAVTKKQKHRYSVDRAPGQWSIVARGGFLRSGSERIEWITVPDPTQAFLAALHARLQARGIAVAGGYAVGAPARTHGILETRRPLHEAVVPLLKDSQNLFADCLARVVDRESGGRGDFSGAGARLQAYLAQVVGSEAARGAVVRDGSGLSSKNRVSTRALVGLLRHASTRAWGSTLTSSLPVAGEDGTLKKRFRKHPLRGQVRAKTGHIRGVSALAGTAETSRGEVFFALIFHGSPGKVAKARRWQERVLGALTVK